MKIFKRFLVLILIVFLTGCSSYDMTMEINKNKSMDFSITILSDFENAELTNSISVYRSKLEKYGYSVSEYNKDNKFGVVISKKIDNIDDVSNGKRSEEFNLLYFYNNDYSNDVESKMFNIDKSFDTNRYAANFYVDLSGLDIDLSNSTVVFRLYVPNGTVSNNANIVSYDGNELVWNITSSGKTEIDFVFELKSYDYIYYGAGILIIIFLVFSIFGNLFVKSGDGDKVENKQLSDGYDLNKKIENISRNAVNKNINIAPNGSASSNNSVAVQSNTLVDNNSTSVNMDNIQRKPVVQSSFNKSVSNSLVPEIEMANFKAPVQEKKKGLFGKFGKKKSSNDDSSSGINIVTPGIEGNDSFSAMVDSISNSSSNSQFGGSTISVNSQITQVNDINTEESLVSSDNYSFVEGKQSNDDSNIPVLGGENIDINNIKNETVVNNEKNNVVNKTEVIANPNLNVNNIASGVTSIDSFHYHNEDNSIDNEVSEEVVQDDAPIIRVNNSSVAVDKNKNENL